MIERVINLPNGDRVFITMYERLDPDIVYQHAVKDGIYKLMTQKSGDTVVEKEVRNDFMKELQT